MTPLERAKKALELTQEATRLCESDMWPTNTLGTLEEHLNILIGQLMHQPKRAG